MNTLSRGAALLLHLLMVVATSHDRPSDDSAASGLDALTRLR